MTDERIILESAAADITIDTSEIVSYRITKTHTGMADLRATLATSTDPTPFAQRKDRIRFEINGSTEFVGVLTRPGRESKTGKRRIKAEGVASRLEESRPDYESLTDSEVSYSSIALEDAIRDYWGLTQFNNVTVVDEPTETVAQDRQITSVSSQTDWEDIISPADDDPYAIRNGSLVVEQTGFVSDLSGTNTDSSYSGGEANDINLVGEDIIFGFTTNYDIPAGNGEFYVRGEGGSGSGSQTSVEVFLDGQQARSETTIASGSLGWSSVFSTDSTLSAGSHTIRITGAQAFDNVKQIFDVLAFVDNRFSYTFDNSVHQPSGFLDGPELAPSSVRIDAGASKSQFNISETAVDAVVNDTTGGQAVGIDLPTDSATDFFDNTASATLTNSGVAREVGVEFELGRYPQQSTNPQSATPRFGYKQQQVDSFDLLADLNSLTVIDELRLRGNHFENLQKLHDYGDYLFVIEHSDNSLADLAVTSFAAGDETRPRPAAYDDPFKRDPEVDASSYHNAVFLRGGEPATGSAPTATAEDSDEIADVGRRVEATVKDPAITTEPGAAFRAQALLRRLVSENDRKGVIEIAKADELLPAGFARPVDFGGGRAEATVEETELRRDANGLRQIHRYAPVDDVSRELEELKRNARSNRNQV
jgi:hypothetical protein